MVPFILNRYLVFVLTVSGILAILAVSWDLLTGYTGQISFASAAFYGIGAYASGLLVVNLGISPWIGMFLGGLITGFFGLVIGFPSLRLRGHYLAIATLGFNEVARLFCLNEREITRGALGLYVTGLPGIPKPSEIWYYYLMVVLLSTITFISYKLVKSPIGIACRAIREDEIGAEAAGINTGRYKLFVFMVSAFFSGVAGAFNGHMVLIVDPAWLNLVRSAEVISMAIFGGIGTLFGPILGAFTLHLVSEFLRKYGEFRLILYGIALISVVTIMPQGIMGVLKSSYRRLRAIGKTEFEETRVEVF
ncbi:MAG: branched-chain amino acid ABC transporter permease [Candidatus Geothermarchaeales archaeon]